MQKVSIQNGPLTRSKEKTEDKNSFSEILSSSMNRKSGDKKEMDVKETVHMKETEETEKDNEKTERSEHEAVGMNLFPEMKTESQITMIVKEGKTSTESVEGSENAVDKSQDEKNPMSELMSRKQNELLSLKEQMNVKDQGRIEIPKDQGKIIPDEKEQIKETSGKSELLSEVLKNGTPGEKSSAKESGKLPEEKIISGKPETAVLKEDAAAKDALKGIPSTGKEPAIKPETGEETKEVKAFKEIYQAMEVKEPIKEVRSISEEITKVEESTVPMNETKATSHLAVSEKVSPKSADFEKTFDNATAEIMKSMETIKEGGRTTMKVNLHPEELGKMEITLTMEDGKLSGKILLDNREIRQIFTERLEELSNTLKSNSIQVGKFEVGVGDQGEGNQARQEGRQQMQSPFRGYFNKKAENTVYTVSPERDLKEINLLA